MRGECMNKKGFTILKLLREIQENPVVISDIIMDEDNELVGE
jgi:hypothetical protein